MTGQRVSFSAPELATEDVDSEPELESPEAARRGQTHAERRQTQAAIFDAWLTSDAGREALVPKQGTSARSADLNGDITIKALIDRQRAEIIKNPRDYQLELFERAKQENTIAVLDTGSGKTLIAVLLLRWIIDQELERRAAGKQPKISFFLVVSINLLFQQHSVLETNLDHNIARVCGADSPERWDRARWAKLFTDNKVIVCTADVLRQCLGSGYVSMDQINLIIFDEAHHTKKNHAYSRIIKDFYLSEVEPSRPRVFGMTASPVDAKTDLVRSATELETLLSSKIATTVDMSLTDAVKKPDERIVTYSALPKPFDTQLLQDLKLHFGHVQTFQELFKKVPIYARELGSWCADEHLFRVMRQEKLKKYEDTTTREFWRNPIHGDVTELDTKLADVRSALDFVEGRKSEAQHSPICDMALSSKIAQLRDYLQWHFSQHEAGRCIVFVERRDAARVLESLFRKLNIPNLHAGYLIGTDVGSDKDNVSFRQQVLTLLRFRNGELNCLFATSVAEEGLDVPDCNLVVRFDMYNTMIQYVQSRGRARQRDSTFIHMIEVGNSIHRQLVAETRYQEIAMRKFCEALPEDRRLLGDEDGLDVLMEKEKTMRSYTVPETGAKLTYSNALVYLEVFVAAIPKDEQDGEPMRPTYIISPHGPKFVAEVILPGNAPLRSAIGRICSRRIMAKRSAAFEACCELRKRQYMDEHLMPTYQRRLPLMRNAHLAITSKDKDQYAMRTKPTVWESTRGTLPNELFVTVVDFPDTLEMPHQPIAFLTRTKMPDFPEFPIYLNDGRRSLVSSKALDAKLPLDQDLLRKLSVFTWRVFKDVFSKGYEEDAAALSYWLAPVLPGPLQVLSKAQSPWCVIDLDSLENVHQSDELKWTQNTTDIDLSNRLLIDRWDGGRKYFSIGVATHLTPQDPVPEDADQAKAKHTILDYTVSLWKKSREHFNWDPAQPVMEARKVLLRRNMLATPYTEEIEKNKKTKAFLCPEPLRISTLPSGIAVSCFAWPAVIHRFESYLIALEACALVGVECKVDVALAAVTKNSDSAGDDEVDGVINFQSGMGENYERLEFIGDTFLKMATSISTFVQNPGDNEFEFHVKRMVLLCNQNMFEVAKELQLFEYIRSRSFTRRIWYPEGMKLLQGKGVNTKLGESGAKHALGEKTIADVCEALIGAAFVSHDRPGEKWHEDLWENAVRAVTKLVTNENCAEKHAMQTWDDYRKAYKIPTYQTGEVTASQRDLAEKVQVKHPYVFRYPKLLRSAFMHPSQPTMYEHIPSYQRLEFLGDALLDMASITHLFYRFPDKDPQWLTEHKMAMVSNKFLGAVCVNIGFHRHLRYSSSTIEQQIRNYATELLEAKRTNGQSRDYWTAVSDPPKCLPDIIEAYIGAIFIDSDFDYNVVQAFFDAHIKLYFEDMAIYDSFADSHPCTQLYHLLQGSFGCRDFRLMAKDFVTDGMEMEGARVVAAVMIHDNVIASSTGKSGNYTKIRAAGKAVRAIESMTFEEFRGRFQCSCAKKHAVNGEINGARALDCAI